MMVWVMIFSNLLNNAIDAFDRLSKKQNIISINCLVKGTKLHLTFFDNGPGIAKEYIEKIWEPFFTDNKDGFGLGLTVVKRLVADLDGSIFVRSQLVSIQKLMIFQFGLVYRVRQLIYSETKMDNYDIF